MRKILILVTIIFIGGASVLLIKNAYRKKSATKQQQDIQDKAQERANSQQRPEDSTTLYKIPEIGIQFLVNKKIANELIYQYVNIDDTEGISFSSRGLSQIFGCGTPDGPLGAITKLKGKIDNYQNKEYLLTRTHKQFNKFVIIYSGPQAVCAISDDDTFKWERYFEDNPEFNDWVSESFDTMTEL